MRSHSFSVRIILACYLALCAVSSTRGEIGEIIYKKRKVEATVAGVVKEAMPGDRLSDSDELETGEYSAAGLQLPNLIALVKERTRLKLEQVPEFAELGIVVDVGKAALTKRRANKFRLRTPAADFDLAKTTCAIEVSPSGESVISVFEGEVHVRPGPGQTRVIQGKKATVRPGQRPVVEDLRGTAEVQWFLYYPGVLQLSDLNFSPDEVSRIMPSLRAYESGDLIKALEEYPIAFPPRSAAGRIYRASIELLSGRVPEARKLLSSVSSKEPGRKAMEYMMAAVLGAEAGESEPSTASEWLGRSYYSQYLHGKEGESGSLKNRDTLDTNGHPDAMLRRALADARNALVLAPGNTYAAARVAELELSFGRISKARKLIKGTTGSSNRNAQAFAVLGFIHLAENRMDDAAEAFERSITLDPELSNGWLGRGLVRFRTTHWFTANSSNASLSDFLMAASVQPQRSLLHSYLGKALAETGHSTRAQEDFEYAKQLDINDPTPWLYSAILKKEQNDYNYAVGDLMESLDLNEKRKVYRSGTLLDQDRAVRGTNLAAIFKNAGLVEQSIREAVRAVDADYTSAAAHLFLANSYNAFRDPTRVQLRYETPWFNELLLSNLLSPVGGGPLSQYVSEQEYSKMFERDGFGFNSVSDYFSDGQFRQVSSQYGTFGNISYALDGEYLYDTGVRPNNKISLLEAYAQFKLQITPDDTLFLQTKFQDLKTGDLRQRYDQRGVEKERAALTLSFEEKQDPGLLLLGWHHAWSPENHTLLLLGRLANEQRMNTEQTIVPLVSRDVALLAPRLEGDPFEDRAVFRALEQLVGRGRITSIQDAALDLEYSSKFETFSCELQHIATLGPNTLIVGGRYQKGTFETEARLTNIVSGSPDTLPQFDDPPAYQHEEVGFERSSIYLLNTLRVASPLSITGGVTYDNLRYPENFRAPPITSDENSMSKVSPKVGFILQLPKNVVFRGAYTQTLGGASFEESVRLEPTQIAGFTQAYRTLASESVVGSVAASEFKLWGLSLEQSVPVWFVGEKLDDSNVPAEMAASDAIPMRTFWGVELNVLQQDFERVLGAFDNLQSLGQLPAAGLPTSLLSSETYREDVVTFTLNQLVGREWSFGARYRGTNSHLRSKIDTLQEGLQTANQGNVNGLARRAKGEWNSTLHEIGIFAAFNHHSGFFARAEANWYCQDNTRLTFAGLDGDDSENSGKSSVDRSLHRSSDIGLPSEDFWQFHVLAGWRFHRNRCELSCGVLNIAGNDYDLDPLNPYYELPRERTFVVRARFGF